MSSEHISPVTAQRPEKPDSASRTVHRCMAGRCSPIIALVAPRFPGFSQSNHYDSVRLYTKHGRPPAIKSRHFIVKTNYLCPPLSIDQVSYVTGYHDLLFVSQQRWAATRYPVKSNRSVKRELQPRAGFLHEVWPIYYECGFAQWQG